MRSFTKWRIVWRQILCYRHCHSVAEAVERQCTNDLLHEDGREIMHRMKADEVIESKDLTRRQQSTIRPSATRWAHPLPPTHFAWPPIYFTYLFVVYGMNKRSGEMRPTLYGVMSVLRNSTEKTSDKRDLQKDTQRKIKRRKKLGIFSLKKQEKGECGCSFYWTSSHRIEPMHKWFERIRKFSESVALQFSSVKYHHITRCVKPQSTSSVIFCYHKEWMRSDQISPKFIARTSL